jgi:hypothetical protein
MSGSARASRTQRRGKIDDSRDESMTGLMERASFVRLFVLIAVLALVAAACGTDTASPTDDPGDSPGETTDPGATDDPGDSPDPGTGGELDTYTLGIFQDVTTDNRWNMYDTAGNTVWNSYFLAPMDAGAYTIAMPGIELQPVLADGELQPAEQDGDVSGPTASRSPPRTSRSPGRPRSTSS